MQEVLHYMHRSNSKEGSMALTIDLEKAYDNVNWDYFELPYMILGSLIVLLS